MNKRLIELYDQATILEGNGDYVAGELDPVKFAELIVQECASRVDNILRERKDGGGTMGDEIREHFGVQE